MNELSIQEFYEIIKLRIDTFVVAQERLYHELDDIDKSAYHIFYKSETTNEIYAYARVFQGGKYVSFGRVVTSSKVRGKGYGLKLTDQIMNLCKKEFPNQLIEIDSQKQVVGFYEKFGFKKEGEPFIFNKTLHVKMRYDYEE